MTESEQLFAAICQAPWDSAPRLIYADYLEDFGDAPRGQMIRLQCADFATLEAEASVQLYELLQAHGARWYAELPRVARVEWSSLFVRGFIDSIAIDCNSRYASYADQAFQAAPIRRLVCQNCVTAARLRSVLGHPMTERLDTLLLNRCALTDASIGLLLKASSLRNITHLDLSGNRFSDHGIEQLLTASTLPRLQKLHVMGNQNAYWTQAVVDEVFAARKSQ
ncbi:MAG: TIGR02996 domain-containing protein [Gemmataceae bacterium]